MSRLDYLKGHEVATQTISEELDYLKRYLASGGKIGSPDLQELSKCLIQLNSILAGIEQKASQAWQEDQEPLPSWLQPKQTTKDLDEEVKPGSAVG